MPEVPSFIINLYSWITYLTPIWGLLIVVFWKPLRRLFNKEKSKFNEIEDKLNQVQIDLDGNKDISKALLHHEIYQCCRIALEDEFITEDELENLELLYVEYRKLGGNGTAQRLYEECCQLPKYKHKEEET